MGDTEKSILRLKQEGSGAEEIIEKVRKGKVDELESTRVELEIAKLKAEIKDLESKGGAVQPQQAQGLVSAVIAQNFATPERAQAFLSGLDEESTNRLALLLAADSPQTQALTNFMKSPTSNVKDIIEIVKLVTANKGEGTMGDTAKLFQVALDYAKTTMPQPQSLEQASNFILGIIKPFQESLNTAQQTALNAQLEAIKAQIPPPLETQVKNLKAMAGELGLSGGGSEKLSELNLKLEEMRQRHDIDMESIRWEKEKFLLGKESDVEKWDKIAGMFSPIFAMPEMRNVITKIGESVGKGIAGTTNPSVPASKSASAQPQVASFVCPTCSTEIGIPVDQISPDVKGLKCPKCGAISPVPAELREGSLSPPEEKPTSTRLKASYT